MDGLKKVALEQYQLKGRASASLPSLDAPSLQNDRVAQAVVVDRQSEIAIVSVKGQVSGLATANLAVATRTAPSQPLLTFEKADDNLQGAFLHRTQTWGEVRNEESRTLMW